MLYIRYIVPGKTYYYQDWNNAGSCFIVSSFWRSTLPASLEHLIQDMRICKFEPKPKNYKYSKKHNYEAIILKIETYQLMDSTVKSTTQSSTEVVFIAKENDIGFPFLSFYFRMFFFPL